ncbi:MAG: HlyD family secretion protein [Thermoguttaceae bacterium]
MMMVNGMERIPTPWRLRWHRFRYTTLPLLGLIGFAAATLLLWTRQGVMPHAIGEIEAIRVEVASPLNGILIPLPNLPEGRWALYDTVEPNQVLAQLDDRPLQAEMATLVQELDRLRKELDAVAAKLAVSEADRRLTYMNDSVRLRVEFEQRSLVALERQAQVVVNRLEAQRRTVYYDCLKPLYDKKIISELELNNARMLRDEAVARAAEHTKVLGEAETQKEAAETRLHELPKFLPADIAAELAPIAAAAQAEQAKIHEVEVQISRLVIRAPPMHGMICAINHWPQSAVKAGEPIVTIGSDERRYLVCYVRQEQHVDPKEGMDVDVRKRAAIAPTVRTVVERIGPQVEQIPIHLARDPKFPEWGLPVRITLPKDFPGYPGELFEVTFKTGWKDTRGGF